MPLFSINLAMSPEPLAYSINSPSILRQLRALWETPAASADGWRLLSGQLAHFRLSCAMKARPAGPGGASFRKTTRIGMA